MNDTYEENWTCLVCNTQNPEENYECNNCGEAKPRFCDYCSNLMVPWRMTSKSKLIAHICRHCTEGLIS